MTDRYSTGSVIWLYATVQDKHECDENHAAWRMECRLGITTSTCKVNGSSANNMPIFDIFRDLYWYSETMGHECMKQTSLVENRLCDKYELEALSHRLDDIGQPGK